MDDPDNSTRTFDPTDEVPLRMSFVQRLTSADVAPLNLNYLFDNIRNYTLAATVMVAGI